jgi:hypothetical protein
MTIASQRNVRAIMCDAICFIGCDRAEKARPCLRWRFNETGPRISPRVDAKAGRHRGNHFGVAVVPDACPRRGGCGDGSM